MNRLFSKKSLDSDKLTAIIRAISFVSQPGEPPKGAMESRNHAETAFDRPRRDRRAGLRGPGRGVGRSARQASSGASEMDSTVDNSGNFAAPPRGPVDAIRTCLVKFFDFRGRASRSEFWWFFLFTSILFVLDDLFPDSYRTLSFFLLMLIEVPLCAVAVRRLHDVNRSGWWILSYAHHPVTSIAIGLHMLLHAGSVSHDAVYEVFVSGMSGYLMPVYGFNWPALVVFTAFAGVIFICSAALVFFCLIKGNPGQNRFD
ncbi:MAG: DUF805 domain-containing protein [Gammaproteobacteria bacterium]|nr:DUF805 domain-containing protein [Gammaproteobacteria bacterium]